MKSYLKCCLLAGGIFALGQVGFGQYVSQDNYWGGVPNSDAAKYQSDVIGANDVFDLTQAEVIMNNGDLTLNIYGNYFDNIMSGEGLYGTTMGDLFLSVDGLDWTNGGAATLDDYFMSPDSYTTWEYAVKLGKYDNEGDDLGTEQVATIHAITEDDIVLSNPGDGVYFREFQEFQVDTDSNPVGLATWYIDEAGAEANDDFLSITIAGFEDLFGSAFDVGFHWTMSCGNDVIEFQPVPEPTTIGILGAAGLMGILFLRRRIVRRK